MGGRLFVDLFLFSSVVKFSVELAWNAQSALDTIVSVMMLQLFTVKAVRKKERKLKFNCCFYWQKSYLSGEESRRKLRFLKTPFVPQLWSLGQESQGHKFEGREGCEVSYSHSNLKNIFRSSVKVISLSIQHLLPVNQCCFTDTSFQMMCL